MKRAYAGLLCGLGGVLAATTAALATNPQPTPPADQSVGQDSTQSTQTSVVVVTTTIQSIRDGIQSVVPRGTGTATPFSTEGLDELGLEALGYSRKRERVLSNPLYKAAPKALAPSNVSYAVWGQTYVDREWRDARNGGIDFGRKSTSVGGVAGFDAVITNVRASNDALVLGILASDTTTTTNGNDRSKTHTRGPGVGAYAAYVLGQFSVDGVYKADFLNLTRTAPTAANLDLGLTNHLFALNLNYKFQLQNSWWVEPTAGFSKSRLVWNDASRRLGNVDGSEWRVQGGARAGTTIKWNKITVDPSLTALLYTPVSIEGGAVPVPAGQPASPSDQGKLFAQAIGKMNFNLAQGLSSYVEGEVRGATGVMGASGRVGVRKSLP